MMVVLVIPIISRCLPFNFDKALKHRHHNIGDNLDNFQYLTLSPNS